MFFIIGLFLISISYLPTTTTYRYPTYVTEGALHSDRYSSSHVEVTSVTLSNKPKHFLFPILGTSVLFSKKCYKN